MKTDPSFSPATREKCIAAMASQPIDLLVVGGGIVGAAVARDAAMRGIKTAIIDKGDFGSGTSGLSSRLIDGGLRYLETGDWRLVHEACRERRTLLRIAPHLVWPQPFLFPVHAAGRVSITKLWSGLALYDLMAMFRNVRRHRMLSRKRTLRMEPSLREAGLRGAGLYYDARCDDARLTLATVRSAHRHDALTANYLKLDDFERAAGKVVGARVTDQINDATYSIHAHVIVNATGPWSDETRAKDGEGPVLRRTKGVHVAVPRRRIGNNDAITMTSPVDGRIMFVFPWGDLSYIGTTDTDDEEGPDLTRATADDVVYLLRSVNAVFPRARLGPEDVVSTWAGVRPLRSNGEAEHPSLVSREHEVLEHDSGVISIVGGTLTTSRAVAVDVVDLAAARLHQLDGRKVAGRAPTETEPLPGGEVRDLDVVRSDVIGEGFDPEIAEHLVQCVGAEAPAVLRLAQADRQLAQPIVAGFPTIRAQLVHAIRREMAMTLTDLLVRRTPIFYVVTGHGVPEAPGLVDLVADELGWDAARKATELAHYLEVIQHGMAFRDELAGIGATELGVKHRARTN